MTREPGHPPDAPVSKRKGQVDRGPPSTGPATDLGDSPRFAPHRHGSRWYLCDRSYSNGIRQHLIRERCGRHRPTLYPPEVRSGLVEQLLPSLPPGSFDLVYLDPPYGVTAGDWDRAPDWEELGRNTARVLKRTGQVILHGQALMAAQAAVGFAKTLAYHYELVWVKATDPDSALHTSILQGPAPMHAHELIHVFRRTDSKVAELTYNAAAMHRRGEPRGTFLRTGLVPTWGWQRNPLAGKDTGWRNPSDVVFSYPTRSGQLYAAKPVDLTRYLIALLTNPGDRVLDPFAGSGTTLVAAHSIGRRSLGIEASPKSWGILKRTLAGIAPDPRSARQFHPILRALHSPQIASE